MTYIDIFGKIGGAVVPYRDVQRIMEFVSRSLGIRLTPTAHTAVKIVVYIIYKRVDLRVGFKLLSDIVHRISRRLFLV